MTTDASAPTRPFLSAQWRWLCVVNYAVDPALLAPFLPAGLAIDFFQEQTFVSLVGFRFLRTAVLGCPALCHRDFDEANLRFYVRRTVGDEVRRGVVFVCELVPKALVAWVARVVYHENYRTARMRSVVQPAEPNAVGRVRYEWDRGNEPCSLEAEFRGEPRALVPGSVDEFILEHYWGYVRRRTGQTAEYQVEHPPWKVWTPETFAFRGDPTPYYGERFARVLAGAPHSAVVAAGSDVAVRRGRILSPNPPHP